MTAILAHAGITLAVLIIFATAIAVRRDHSARVAPAPVAPAPTWAQRETIDRSKLPLHLRDALIVSRGLYVWIMVANGQGYRVDFYDDGGVSHTTITDDALRAEHLATGADSGL